MIVYYYEVYFNISTEAWYHDSVKTIFSSGPLILFVIGIIFLIIYSNIREMSGNFKLFFLWGFLHGINMLFGALLVGTLFETGVGHVISWMYIMDTGRMLYSTISIFILVVAGMMSLRHFLISGNAYFNEVTGENRGFLLRAQVLIPFFAGNAIIFLVRQPHFMYYETFTNMVLIICLLPIFVASGTAHDLFFDEDERKPRLEWIALVMLAVITPDLPRGAGDGDPHWWLTLAVHYKFLHPIPLFIAEFKEIQAVIEIRNINGYLFPIGFEMILFPVLMRNRW